MMTKSPAADVSVSGMTSAQEHISVTSAVAGLNARALQGTRNNHEASTTSRVAGLTVTRCGKSGELTVRDTSKSLCYFSTSGQGTEDAKWQQRPQRVVRDAHGGAMLVVQSKRFSLTDTTYLCEPEPTPGAMPYDDVRLSCGAAAVTSQLRCTMDREPDKENHLSALSTPLLPSSTCSTSSPPLLKYVAKVKRSFFSSAFHLHVFLWGGAKSRPDIHVTGDLLAQRLLISWDDARVIADVRRGGAAVPGTTREMFRVRIQADVDVQHHPLVVGLLVIADAMLRSSNSSKAMIRQPNLLLEREKALLTRTREGMRRDSTAPAVATV